MKRVCNRVRVVEVAGEADRVLHAGDGAVGEARRPAEQSRDRVGHDSGVRSDPELDESRGRRFEVGDGLVGMIDGDRDVVHPVAADAGQQVRLGQERWVRLPLGDFHQLARRGHRRLDLRSHESECRQAPQRGETVAVPFGRVETPERLSHRAFRLRCKAADSKLRPRQIRPQREFVVLPFGRLGQRGERLQKVVAQPDDSAVVTPRLVVAPQRFEQFVQTTHLGLLNPVVPRGPEVAELIAERVEHAGTVGVRELSMEIECHRGVVGRMRTPCRRRGRRVRGELLGCVLADRLEHREPWPSGGIWRHPYEVLVKKRTHRLDGVDVADRWHPAKRLLDVTEPGVTEDREVTEHFSALHR